MHHAGHHGVNLYTMQSSFFSQRMAESDYCVFDGGVHGLIGYRHQAPGGRNVYDIAATLFNHLGVSQLAAVKHAPQIDIHYFFNVGFRGFTECPCYYYACVVNQNIQLAMVRQNLVYGVLKIPSYTDVQFDRGDSSITVKDKLIDINKHAMLLGSRLEITWS